MLKVVLKSYCLLFFVLLVLIITVLNLFDDSLFFHSDPSSILIFTSSLATLGALAALVPVFAVSIFSSKAKSSLPVVLARACTILILAALFWFLIDILFREFDVTSWLRKKKIEYAVFAIYALSLALMALFVSRTKHRQEYEERVTTVAILLALLCSGLLIWNRYSNPTVESTGLVKPKRVVLLVLDAWPGNLLHSFNPAMKPRELDEKFKHALVYTNMRTTTPWTNGYFGTLYTGNPKINFKKWPSTITRWRNSLTKPSWNLFSALQNANVKTRWMVWHNAGIPESKQVSTYHGYRSVFFTSEYLPILNAFRHDYNVLLSSPALESLAGSQRKRWLFRSMNSYPGYDNILIDVLLPQMRQLQKDPQNTFLVFHCFWQIGTKSGPVAWRADETADLKGKAFSRMRENDYRYPPEDEPYVQEIRKGFENSTWFTNKRIQEFLQQLEQSELMDDTLLILTSDHGQIADRGKLWYGYHAEEEVLRVPLVVLYHGRSGVDDRILETRDLVKTITDFFGASSAPDSGYGVSLLGQNKRAFSANITLKSNLNKEWYLTVYDQDSKYLFNLHPQGSAESVRFELNRFDQKEVERGASVIQKVKRELKRTLIEFGVPSEELHWEFRKLIEDSPPGR